MIYFIREKGNSKSLIKIGYTDNVDQRLMQIQANSPVELEILAIIEGDKNLEAELHNSFAKYRVRGEWFEPAKKLTIFIYKIAPSRKQFEPFFSLKAGKIILQIGKEKIITEAVSMQTAYSVLNIAEMDTIVVGGVQFLIKNRIVFFDYIKGIIDGQTLAITNWTGAGKPFSRGEYEDLLAQLRKSGFVGIHPGTGNVLTRTGLDAFNEYIKSIS